MKEKKTKIICTIADNNCDVELIAALYEKGMNVVRINSAHATIEGAQKIVDNVRKVSDKIGILIDTKGPEVRLTKGCNAYGRKLNEGDSIIIRDGVSNPCEKDVLYTTYEHFTRDVPEGAHILIDDGSVDLLVRKKTDEELICVVQNDGAVKSGKSINVPGVHIKLPALTEKDKKFINWAIEANLDFIAHSFVRFKEDLLTIQDILDKNDSHIKLIAKIENQQGVDNIEDILTYCYGVMVARGDLGVEIDAEKIPRIQNHIVHRCRVRKKPSIVATQMLQTMIENPRPTRAEVTDIAAAIFQSADCIMLSGETAFGKYPTEAVKVMNKIAIENEPLIKPDLTLDLSKVVKPVASVLARSLVSATMELPVEAIIFDTYSGRTGRYLSTFRPKVPVYAMCYNDYTVRELALVYNIYPYLFHHVNTKETFVKDSIDILLKDGKIKEGDLVGFVGGSFDGEVGATYMELVEVAGHHWK